MLNTVQINKKNHKTKKEYSMFWQNLYYEMRSIAYDALELADEYSGGDSETLRELVKRLDAVDNYRNELEMEIDIVLPPKHKKKVHRGNV